MQHLYLFGYPLGHSISPSMQNAALRARGIRATRYEKYPMPPDHMDDMLVALRAPNCLGANVTVPHKQTIMPHLDALTDLARGIGAVNTILKRDGKLIGDNTDAYGFLRSLRLRRVNPKGLCVAILGAGGAAAASCYALAQSGAREINLLNRTPDRAQALANRLQPMFPKTKFLLNQREAFSRAQLVVNSTSVGMSPHINASPLPPACVLPDGVVVFDLVYNPPLTQFLRDAQERGARTIGGLEMLIYQGACAFQLWTNQRAPIRIMRTAANKALQEMRRAA